MWSIYITGICTSLICKPMQSSVGSSNPSIPSQRVISIPRFNTKHLAPVRVSFSHESLNCVSRLIEKQKLERNIITISYNFITDAWYQTHTLVHYYAVAYREKLRKLKEKKYINLHTGCRHHRQRSQII